MWLGSTIGAPCHYIVVVWVCAYICKVCTKLGCFHIRFCECYEIPTNSNYLTFYFGMQNYPIHKGNNLDKIKKKPIICVIMKQWFVNVKFRCEKPILKTLFLTYKNDHKQYVTTCKTNIIVDHLHQAFADPIVLDAHTLDLQASFFKFTFTTWVFLPPYFPIWCAIKTWKEFKMWYAMDW
jgi:hypothetical protein